MGFSTTKFLSGKGLAVAMSFAVATPVMATELDEGQAAEDQGNKESTIVVKTIRKFTKPKINLRRSAPSAPGVTPKGNQDTKIDPETLEQYGLIMGTSDDGNWLDNAAGWASVTFNFDHETPQGFENRNTTLGLITGGDTFITDDFMAGISLGYTRSNADIEALSAGGAFASTDMDTDTVIVAPYGTYFINEKIYADAVVGFGKGEVEIDTSDPAGGANQNSAQDSRMVFASTSINFQELVDDWDLFTSFSYNISKSYLQSGTNNFNGAVLAGSEKVVQFWGVDLEAGYAMSDAWRVYGGVSAEMYGKAQAVGFNDAGGTAIRVDDSSWGHVNLGTDYFYSDDISASFEANRSVGHDDVYSWGSFVNLRMNF